MEDAIITEQNKQKGEDKQYKKGLYLGKGGFATVYEFKSLQDNEIFAAKIIQKSGMVKEKQKSKLLSEIKIHRQLDHKNIAKFKHVFEDKNCVYILLEICQNRSLSDLLKRRRRLTEIEAQCYLVQILHAVDYMHSNFVIHRDLKLGNIFLNEKMEVKIGDLGLASKIDSKFEKRKTICGTPNYIAPEVLDSSCGHSFEVDIWSIGVILYTLLIGRPPFESSDVKETYRRVKKCSYQFPDKVPISKMAKGLIQSLLQIDPKQRLKIDEIFKHEFLQGNIPQLMPVSTLACAPSQILYKSQQDIRTKSTDLLRPQIQNKQFEMTSRVQNFRTTKIGFQDDNNGNLVIVKWVDLTQKYGFGYLFSNGQVGIEFNDHSRILLIDNQIKSYLYMEKQNGQQLTQEFKRQNTPAHLEKKYKLLLYFQRYLVEDQDVKINQKQEIYVKKWIKTKHAIVFRFSNNFIQSIFEDKTQIQICQQSKQITFINKQNDKIFFTLENACISSNQQMIKRLKYTKEIIQSSSNKNQENQDIISNQLNHVN